MPIDPPPSSPQPSLLELLEKGAGGVPRIALREDDSTPLLRPIEGRLQAGKYQLQGEIARGGVGIVLKGHDTHLGRDVALKVIRQEYADLEEVTHRFVEEAQIGGQLQHPGIVPVYDLGMHEGRPFFTMKLIKGRTLAAVLEEKGESRRRLLAIFEAVCQTMAYAHARGVIHRDLKPANVMVGAFGEVKVVDWGMGKVLKAGGVADERRATRAHDTIVATVRSGPGSTGSQSLIGHAMGTPAYMPPEQALGDVDGMDERSDVFALGAILAEILTGRPPYAGTPYEILPLAARADLKGCFERLATCDADETLKAVVRECLSPLRDARPRHAGELAQRVGSYLAALEEKARAAQVEAAEERVRVAEAKRKQKLTLALATSVVLTLLVGGGALWWMGRQTAERKARLRDQLQAAILEAAHLEDPAAALPAAARARDLLAQLESAPPPSSVAELERIESQALARQRRTQIERENEALLDELEHVRGPGAEDDRFSVDWSTMDQGYARALARLGLKPDEGSVDEAAAALRERGNDLGLAAVLDDWTGIRRELGDTAGSRRLTDVAVRLDGDLARVSLRAAVFSEDIATLARLAAAADVDSMDPRTILLMGQSLLRLGSHAAAQALLLRAHDAHPGDFLIALYTARAVYAVQRTVPGASYREPLAYWLVSRSLRPDSYIANVELAQQYLNARDFERAEALFRNLLRSRPTDAILQGELALVMQFSGRVDEAESHFRAALSLDPGATWVQRMLANLLTDQGRLDEAAAMLEDILEHNPRIMHAHLSLGIVRARQSRRPDAVAALRRAYELCAHDAPTLVWLAAWLNDLGEFQITASAMRHAIQLDDAPADPHRLLGLTLWNMGDLDGALAEFQRAVARSRDAPGEAANRTSLGEVLLQRGDLEGAKAEFGRAVELDPGLAQAHVGLSQVRAQADGDDAALAVLQHAIQTGPKSAMFITIIGGRLSDTGKIDAALEVLRRAVELDPRLALAHRYLGITLRRSGDLDGAIAALRQAVAAEVAAGLPVESRSVLGDALLAKGDLDAATVEFEKILALDHEAAPALAGLAHVHRMRGDAPGAIALLHRAVQTPTFDADALTTMGGTLSDLGDLEAAAATLRRAIQSRPNLARAHRFLGITLFKTGETQAAKDALRRSIELDTDPIARAIAHSFLGLVRANTGDEEGAVAELRRALELDPKQAMARDLLGQVQKQAEMRTRLEAVLAGQDRPVDWREAISFAGWAMEGRLDPAGALRLYREALAAHPALADEPLNSVRYNAACAASVVGGAEREQALAWLRDDLALLDARLSAEAAQASMISQLLAHWRADADLASIRDAADLAEPFRALWADVAALQERAAAAPK